MLIPNKITVTYDAISPDGKKYSEKTESNAVNTEILTYSVSKKYVPIKQQSVPEKPCVIPRR